MNWEEATEKRDSTIREVSEDLSLTQKACTGGEKVCLNLNLGTETKADEGSGVTTVEGRSISLNLLNRLTDHDFKILSSDEEHPRHLYIK